MLFFHHCFEVFCPCLSEEFCNRYAASFQKFVISKNMVPITVLHKLYSNSLCLLTGHFLLILIWDISMFNFLLMTSKTILSVSLHFCFCHFMNHQAITARVLLLIICFFSRFFTFTLKEETLIWWLSINSSLHFSFSTSSNLDVKNSTKIPVTFSLHFLVAVN